MSIVWIDIWDVQSRSKAKSLINQCFNVGRYIAMIKGTNINLRVLQCKNSWKWGHTTFSYRIQEAKYVKYNSPHKSENYCQFGQCCKANNKINPPYFETKKGKPYLYVFKYSNCYGDHQTDSNQCLFWKYRFNYDWHNKKIVKICENRTKSIHLAVSGITSQFVTT